MTNRQQNAIGLVFTWPLDPLNPNCTYSYKGNVCQFNKHQLVGRRSIINNKVIKLFDSLQFYSLIRRLQEWNKKHGIQSEDLSDIFPEAKKKKKVSADQSSLF